MSLHFSVEEKSIRDLHEAFLSGAATAEEVTASFLRRIAAYDRQGPQLWALVVTNPGALADARALDEEFRRTGRFVGPLHGIPVIVKDNIDVAGLQTTAGSGALVGWVPDADADVVTRIRDAGGIILAKATMSEWARGGRDSVSSVLPSFARNPYNTAYGTGGSSGGTASGLAANFAVIGIGTDTLGSVRNPSSNNATVALRPTKGLVPTGGMAGLYPARDTVGPMARTVADLATLLDVIADPAGSAKEPTPATFSAALTDERWRDARVGVLRQAFSAEATDPQVLALVEQAIADLRALGVAVVDPVTVADYGRHVPQRHPPSEMRRAIESYLATTGPDFPTSMREIVESGKFHPVHEAGLREIMTAPDPDDDPVVAELERSEAAMRDAYLAAMDDAGVDVLLLPVVRQPPLLNGDRTLTDPGATTAIASALQWPAAVVPMGYTYEDLPSGLQLMGTPGSDALLVSLAHAYEQRTQHRHPPSTVPALEGGSHHGD